MEERKEQSFGAIPGRHRFTAGLLSGKTVSGGSTDYVLLLPKNADKNILYAADELTYFFKEATGIILNRVQDAGSFAGKCISLGETCVGEGVSVPPEIYGESGCRVVTVGENYILKGGKYGILYAVYDLLRVLFGYEVFSDRTIRLKRDVKELPLYATDIDDVPDFRFRAPSHAYIKYNERLRNRFRMILLEGPLDGEGGPYHNNFNYLPPEKYAAEHPKWYSDDGGQMCYTAHGDETELALLVSTAAEALKKFIVGHPDTPYIAFNHQDNFDWCTCPACTAMKEKYGGANSATAAVFLNRVRAELQKWFDADGKIYDRGQKLVFFAYHGTNKPPVRYIPETDSFELIDENVVLKGVIPWFAETNADYTCPLTEGETNLPVARNMRGWRLLADELLFWTYGTNFVNYLVPYPSFGATRQTYRFAKEQGAGMLFDECQINADVCTAWEELKGYLNYKLAWNTEEDEESLSRDFFCASYGKAAERMLAVYKAWRARGEKQIAAGFSGWRSEFIDPIRKDFWDRAELEAWEAQINLSLEESREDDPALSALYARNIRLERIWVRYLLAEVYADEYSEEELAGRRLAAAEDIRACGLNMFNEQKKIETLFEKWGVK